MRVFFFKIVFWVLFIVSTFFSAASAQENKDAKINLLNGIPTPFSTGKVPTLEELQHNTFRGRPFVFGAPVVPQKEQGKGTSSDLSQKMKELHAREQKMEEAAAERASKTEFFSSRLQERQMREAQAKQQWEEYQKNRMKFYPLAFDGESTVILIPPDNLVEVPLADHIAYFFTRIEIMADGSVTVSETIQRIVSRKTKSFLGLDRYFPYTYTDRAGRKRDIRLTPLTATHNDKPVTVHTYPSLFGFRVSMEEDAPLNPGVHVYRWSYTMTNAVSDYGDFKELIWSVTGNQWFFPVTRAGAHVIFPQKTEVLSQSAKTGNFSLTNDLYRTKRDANGDISFTLQYPVGAGEDFVIMTNFKETLPVFVPKRSFFDVLVEDYGTSAAAFVMFLFVLSYYLATWQSVRKNQMMSFQNLKPSQKNDIFPAVVRYALSKKIDAKNFFILVLGMATKGFLACKELPDGGFQLIKKTDKTTALTPMEKKIAAELFPKKETAFTVNDANGLKLNRLFDKIIRMIRKDYADKYVTVYVAYFLFGLLMTAVAVGFIAGVSAFPVPTAVVALTIMVFTVAMYLIVIRWRDQRRSGAGRVARFVSLSALVFFAVPCAVLIWFFGVLTSAVAAFFLTATLVCVTVFYTLLKSPSVLGRSVLDTMDAYRVYLSSATAESPFAAMRNAENKIRLQYDKHLAFAAALDLETEWTRKIMSSVDAPETLKPSWYVGKLPFDDVFVKKLFESFALHFPKKTYYFGAKHSVDSRSRVRATSSRFGKK